MGARGWLILHLDDPDGWIRGGAGARDETLGSAPAPWPFVSGARPEGLDSAGIVVSPVILRFVEIAGRGPARGTRNHQRVDAACPRGGALGGKRSSGEGPARRRDPGSALLPTRKTWTSDGGCAPRGFRIVYRLRRRLESMNEGGTRAAAGHADLRSGARGRGRWFTVSKPSL